MSIWLGIAPGCLRLLDQIDLGIDFDPNAIGYRRQMRALKRHDLIWHGPHGWRTTDAGRKTLLVNLIVTNAPAEARRALQNRWKAQQMNRRRWNHDAGRDALERARAIRIEAQAIASSVRHVSAEIITTRSSNHE